MITEKLEIRLQNAENTLDMIACMGCDTQLLGVPFDLEKLKKIINEYYDSILGEKNE